MTATQRLVSIQYCLLAVPPLLKRNSIFDYEHINLAVPFPNRKRPTVGRYAYSATRPK